MTLLKQAKFKPDEVVVCIESFVGTLPNGNEVSAARGARMRADSEAVKRWPQLFVIDGADDAEIHKQREAVIYRPVNEEAERADRAFREERAKHEPPPIPIDRQLRVRRGFQLGFGRRFGEGQVVDREDATVKKIVQEHPEFFETPGRPLV